MTAVPLRTVPRPTKRSCLECLTKKRLLELDRELGLGTRQPEPKEAFVEALAGSKAASFAKLLDVLRLDELRHVCRAHELPVTGSKAQLVERLRSDEGGRQGDFRGAARREAAERRGARARLRSGA